MGLENGSMVWGKYCSPASVFNPLIILLQLPDFAITSLLQHS